MMPLAKSTDSLCPATALSAASLHGCTAAWWSESTSVLGIVLSLYAGSTGLPALWLVGSRACHSGGENDCEYYQQCRS